MTDSDPQRTSVIDHLRAAERELTTGDSEAAVDHIRAATRLLGDVDFPMCEATASADDLNHHVRHRTFGHVCTALAGHYAAHLCSCGHTWRERIVEATS